MSKIITDKKRIEEIFNRGIVFQVLPSKEELLQVLYSGKRLKIYIGADPTSDALHLSHAKNYMLLEEFRQLGHEVVILIGDFTARIGDPSDREDTRTQLSEKQVKDNVKSWISQIKPLLDFDSKANPPKILYNSKWLGKLSFEDVISLSANFTVQQILERDMFQKRIKKNVPIYLHEFLYPLMQGYDSVVLDVDIELCGTDQIFNALVGRTLLKRLKNKDKFVMVVNLMENPKTGELMSKSKGTGVFLSSSPENMYGAIMAQPDEMIEPLFINDTRIPLVQKDEIMARGPRDAKALVALDIVRRFYGKDKAMEAQNKFEQTFVKKELPKDMPAYHIKQGETIVEVMVASNIVESKAEAKRLIEQKAVTVNNNKVFEWTLELKRGDTLQVGPRRFLKIK